MTKSLKFVVAVFLLLAAMEGVSTAQWATILEVAQKTNGANSTYMINGAQSTIKLWANVEFYNNTEEDQGFWSLTRFFDGNGISMGEDIYLVMVPPCETVEMEVPSRDYIQINPITMRSADIWVGIYYDEDDAGDVGWSTDHDGMFDWYVIA